MYNTLKDMVTKLRQHLPVTVAIREAVRMYKEELNEFLVQTQEEEDDQESEEEEEDEST